MEGNKLNPFTVLKSPSSGDSNQTLGPVSNKKSESTSTASQTIINLDFPVNQSQKDGFALFIDGFLKKDAAGAGNYLFTNIVNNSSSEITLGTALSAGLNIKATMFGVKSSQFLNSPLPTGVPGIGINGFATEKTANYTTVDGDKGKIIPVNSTSNPVLITLHSPSSYPFLVTVIDSKGISGTNNISTVSTDGAIGFDNINTTYGSSTYMWNGTKWTRIVGYYRQNPTARGVFGGGIPAYSAVIDYITIDSESAATNFGNLTVARIQVGACSSSTRGLFAGGDSGSNTNIIDFITIASAGNATDFGDLTSVRIYTAGCSSSVRGVFGGGDNVGEISSINYVTMATQGDALNFGNLIANKSGAGAFSSPTRGIFGNGTNNGGLEVDTIDYITIATLGSIASFGTSTLARRYNCGASNSTRGLFAGGGAAGVSTTDYVTIATVGSINNFGSLVGVRTQLAGCASNLRAVFAGGYDGSSTTNLSAYFTIATLGNATNFGNLTVARRTLGGCSNGHGGL